MSENRKRRRELAKRGRTWKRRRHADHANQGKACRGRSCQSKISHLYALMGTGTTLGQETGPDRQASYRCGLMLWNGSPYALVPPHLHLPFRWGILMTNRTLP